MPTLSTAQIIAAFVLPGVLAITLHEVAHGYAARQLGDRTAEMLGRLTLNPLKHVDPVGTVIVPLALLLASKLFIGQPLVFGWAKPVPIGVRNFRNPRRDMSLVAAAGPAVNMVMALGWAVIHLLATKMGSDLAWLSGPLRAMAALGVFINIVLAVLNMIPLPPLDGGRVASGLMSPGTAMKFDRIEPYGLLILIALMVTGLLQMILLPIIVHVLRAVQSLVGTSVYGDLARLLI